MEAQQIINVALGLVAFLGGFSGLASAAATVYIAQGKGI